MAWGPKNLQTVLLPAERSFPSTDTNTITDVEVSSCGRFLAFSQTAGACVIYELRSGEPIFVEVEDRSLDAISLWSKDDQHKLLVGGTSCTLYVWDLIRHREIKRFPDMPARIYGVSWGPSGMFAACCGTEFVRIQKMTLDETLFEKKYDKESIYAVALNPIDPGQVIYGGTEGWCYVIQWKEGESVVERAKEETAIEQMQGRVNNCPCFPHKAKQDAERKVYHGSVITATEYDPTGTLFMTGGGTTVKVWAVEDLALHRVFSSDDFLLDLSHGDSETWECAKVDIDGVSSAKFSPEGDKLVVAGGFHVIVWSVTTGGELHRFTHTEKLNAANFASEGSVCAGGLDAEVTVRDLTSSVETRVINQHGVQDVSADGRLYLMNDSQGRAEVRGLLTNEPVCFTNFSSSNKDARGELSPNSQFLAMHDAKGADDDRLVRLIIWRLVPHARMPAYQRQKLTSATSPSRLAVEESKTATPNGLKIPSANDSDAETYRQMDFHIPENWSSDMTHVIDFLVFSPDEHWVALAIAFLVLIIDVETGALMYRYKDPRKLRTRSLAFSGDQNELARGNVKGTMTLHKVGENEREDRDEFSRPPLENEDLKVTHRAAEVTHRAAEVMAYDLEALLQHKEMVHHTIEFFEHGKTSVTSIDFFSPPDQPDQDSLQAGVPGAQIITSTGSDMFVWDRATRRKLKQVPSLCLCRFSPDGQYVVASESDRRSPGGTLVLLSTRHWKAIRRVRLDSPLVSLNFLRESNESDESRELMILTQTSIRIWDFTRFRVLAPSAEQLIHSKYDREYVTHISEEFPYLLFETIHDPIRHEDQTFIQHLVANGNIDLLQKLLHMVPDSCLCHDNGSCFDIVIAQRSRKAVRILLQAMLTTTQPSARRPLVAALPELIEMYPDLVADYFAESKLLELPCSVKECRLRKKIAYKGDLNPDAHFLWDDFRTSLEPRDRVQLLDQFCGWFASEPFRSRAVHAVVIPLPGVANLELIMALQSFAVDDINNEIVRGIIGCMWDNHVSPVFLFRFCSFLVLFFAAFSWCHFLAWQARGLQYAFDLCIDINTTQIDDDECRGFDLNKPGLGMLTLESRIHVSGLYGGIPHNYSMIAGFLDLSLFLFGLMYLYLEAKQLRRNGVKDYMTSLWNLNDLFFITLLVVTPCVHQSDPWDHRESVVQMASLCCIALALKMMSYFRAFESTGFMVRMLVQMTYDLRFFALLVVIFILSFAMAFYLLSSLEGGEQDDDGGDDDGGGSVFYSPHKSVYVTWLMFLGDWDGDVLWDSSIGMTPLVFFFFTVIGNVIMLNTVIALLSDSYSEVKTNTTAYNLLERASLVIEFMEEMGEVELEEFHNENRWIHCLIPAEHRDDEEEDRDSDKDGLIKHINSRHDVLLQHMSRELSVLHRFMERLDDRVDHLSKEMPDISKTVRQVSAELKRVDAKESQIIQRQQSQGAVDGDEPQKMKAIFESMEFSDLLNKAISSARPSRGDRERSRSRSSSRRRSNATSNTEAPADPAESTEAQVDATPM